MASRDELLQPPISYVEETERENILYQRYRKIEDRVRLIVNNKYEMKINDSLAQYLIQLYQEGSPAIISAEYDTMFLSPPRDELEEYSTDDEHWIDYTCILYLKLKYPYYLFVNKDDQFLLEFLRESSMNAEETIDFLTVLQDLGIMKEDYFLDPMIDICEIYAFKRCLTIIRSGIRKGHLCNRPIHQRGKCSYHARKGTK